MSIVGTRPPLISETNLYELHHYARLAIKPGITGLWQVSGRSDITDFEEVVRLDKEYIEKPKSCTRGDRNPDHIAKNYLHREFHAEKPNEKWLTDVSEFKYYNGIEVHKVYLSAILDLYDRRIVSFKISDHNDNPLVIGL